GSGPGRGGGGGARRPGTKDPPRTGGGSGSGGGGGGPARNDPAPPVRARDSSVHGRPGLDLVGPVEDRDHAVPLELRGQGPHHEETCAVGMKPFDQGARRHLEEVGGCRSGDLPVLDGDADGAEPDVAALPRLRLQSPRARVDELPAVVDDLVSAGRPKRPDAAIVCNLPLTAAYRELRHIDLVSSRFPRIIGEPSTVRRNIETIG